MQMILKSPEKTMKTNNSNKTASYKAYTQKSVAYLQISHEQSEKEMKKTIII